jgi:hypothetical protein
MTLAQLPAYTADCPFRNLRFELPDISNYGLSGGAIAVTSTLEFTPRRTLAGTGAARSINDVPSDAVAILHH